MKIWKYTALLLLATGCAAVSSENPTAESVDFPKGWPLPIEGGFDHNECAPIDGTYHSGGQSNSSIGERFSDPIFERSFFYLDGIADNSNRFKVSVNPEEQRLYFDILNQLNEPLATGLYKFFSECENGWFVIEAYSEGGSGDTPIQSSYRRTSIGSAEDGSLLVNSHTEGVWRKHFLGRETRVSNIWYKFERVGQ